jgi:hypothetical protein
VRRAVTTAAGIGFALWAGVSCRQSEIGSPSRSAVPAVRSAARFVPPADGLVTDAQLDRYVKVRRAARGRTDEKTAQAVGVNAEELAWVRSRVLEAVVYLETTQVRNAADGTYARTIASLKEAAKGARDRETIRKLEEQIAALERERASLKTADATPPAVIANARKIAPRRAELEQ